MKIQYFENVKSDKQLQFIRGHNHCPLCGQTLEFRFERDINPTPQIDESVSQTIIPKICEVAVCPECEVQSKSQYYVVQ